VYAAELQTNLQHRPKRQLPRVRGADQRGTQPRAAEGRQGRQSRKEVVHVRQLPIDDRPLLAELLACALRQFFARPPATTTGGDLRADLDAGPRNADLAWYTSRDCAFLAKGPAQQLCPRGVEVRGVTYYPACGGIGWHTNSDAPGWRVYVPCSPYLDKWRAGLHTTSGFVADRPGFANAFKVGEWRDSWHAVECTDPRLVVGVRLSDAIAIDWGLERAAVRRRAA